MSLQIESYFENNTIIILKSLSNSELDTATNLFNDLQTFASTVNIEFYDLTSKDHLFNIILDIKNRSKAGLKPIIHFETHGNKTHGLHINATNEFMSWIELVEHFREINIITNNSLGVVMAACFGLYAIEPIKIFEPSPYFILIASPEEVGIDYINSQIRIFYKALLTDTNLYNAMNAINDEFIAFHSEKFLTISVAEYFKKYCMGAGARERQRNLMQRFLIENPDISKEILIKIKRTLKENIKPNHRAFNRLVHNFIIDKNKYNVTFYDIMKLIRQSDK